MSENRYENMTTGAGLLWQAVLPKLLSVLYTVACQLGKPPYNSKCQPYGVTTALFGPEPRNAYHYISKYFIIITLSTTHRTTESNTLQGYIISAIDSVWAY